VSAATQADDATIETETETGGQETQTATVDATTTESVTAVPETTTATEGETPAAIVAAVPARATANHETQTATASPRRRNRQLLLPRHRSP
jgi:hypothetical protein